MITQNDNNDDDLPMIMTEITIIQMIMILKIMEIIFMTTTVLINDKNNDNNKEGKHKNVSDNENEIWQQ